MGGLRRKPPRTEDRRERDAWRRVQDDDNFSKANKVVDGVENNTVTLTNDGDIQDSGKSFDDIILKKRRTITTSVDYEVLEIDEIIWVDASAGDVTVTLYSSATVQGQEFIVEKIDSTTNKVIVAGSGSDTVNGDPTFDLLLQYESVQPRSTGAGYLI
jgi:hypothetical protein